MSLKIAFASTDRRRIDQHFGAAEAFAVFEISEDAARLVAVAEFIETAMDGHEGKLAGKIALLDGVAAVYCNAVGSSAVQQLLAKGIQPVKVDEGTVIEAVLVDLRASLLFDPPAWMAKHLKRQRTDGSRFAAMAEEGWDE
ncbi:MAG: NifB/NifX family molybdenum-iron cluster-binding protein [Thiotrichales bacterium]